jgi:hypothetical protein
MQEGEGMSPSPILVSIDPNEAARPRVDLIRGAVEKDEHFYSPIGVTASLPFDLQFISQRSAPCKDNPDCWTFPTLHVELKDFSEEGNSDYLSSILSGHLWEQCLAARELGEPFVIVVLGDDADISSAIRKAAGHAQKGKHGLFDLDKFNSYVNMVDGFEANAISLGIPVWHLGYNQFPRLLLRVRKILQGGDLSGFAPSPPDGEREKVGLSILAGKGIGPAKAGAILQHFGIWLVPDPIDSYLTDCDGIGQKLAEQIARNVRIGNGAVVRPPKPKKAKLAEVLG